MRLLKFRGKRTDGKGWVYGDYFYCGYKTGHFIREGFHTTPTNDEPGGGYYQEDYEVDPKTIGQMVNINNVESYEGDVIEAKNATYNEYDFTGIVDFVDSTFVLRCVTQSESARKHNYIDLVRFWKDGCHDHHSLEMLNDRCCKIEILGNIHDDSQFQHND